MDSSRTTIDQDFEKYENFKKEISNIKTFKEKINKIYKKEFENTFKQILTLTKESFFSSITNSIKILLNDMYSEMSFKNNILNEIQDDCEDELENEYNIHFEKINREWDNYIKNNKRKNNNSLYLSNYRKHCCDSDEFAYHNCQNESKFLIINVNNSIKYVICINCQNVYFSSCIQCHCYYCNVDYYSSLLNKNENPDLLIATWKNYHCTRIINEKMKCINCKKDFYLNLKTKELNCINPKCNFITQPLKILWTCVICNKDFKSEAIVYNPLEYSRIKSSVYLSLLIKHKAHPRSVPCCFLNVYNTIFRHNEKCDGILLEGEIENKIIIICEKCKAINLYERFVWTCPKCGCRFKDSGRKYKKKPTLENNFLKGISSSFHYGENKKLIRGKTCLLDILNARKCGIKIKTDIFMKKARNMLENLRKENENELRRSNYTMFDRSDNDFEDYKIRNLTEEFYAKDDDIPKKSRNKKINLDLRISQESKEKEEKERKRQEEKERKEREKKEKEEKERKEREKKEKEEKERKEKEERERKRQEERERKEREKKEKEEKERKEKEEKERKKKEEKERKEREKKEKEEKERKEREKKEKEEKEKKEREEKERKKKEEEREEHERKREEYLKKSRKNMFDELIRKSSSKIIPGYNKLESIKEENDNNPYKKKINNLINVKEEIISSSDEDSDIISEESRFETKGKILKNDKNVNNGHFVFENSIVKKKIDKILQQTKIPIFNVDDYEIQSTLGEGSYGVIYKVKNINDNKIFAMKKIIAHDVEEIEDFHREYELVSLCSHPNIMKIYAMNIKTLDITTYALYILIEIAKCDWDKEIKERLQNRKYYKENELISILKQLVNALYYMQSKMKVTHRDIKPQNILLFNNNVYKLADFGEAKAVKPTNNKLNTLRGTELYMSPALYDGLKQDLDDVSHDPFKSDVFSLGFCFMYAAFLNFNIVYEVRDVTDMKKLEKILHKHLKNKYSEKFITVLVKMLEIDEMKRFDFLSIEKYIDDNYSK